MPQVPVLMVSQDSSMIEALQIITNALADLSLEVCDTLTEAPSFLGQNGPGLVIAHLTAQHQEKEVVAFLRSLTAARPTCPILLFSDEYQSDQAVTFLRAGATEYYGPMQDLNKVSNLIDLLTMFARSEAENGSSGKSPEFLSRLDPRSYTLAPEMLDVMDQLRRVIPQETTLLLVGETGTGKTRLARLIHELSPRRDEPFMVVDCSSLSSNLIESEMFGHVRGAFTGADREHAGKFAAAGKGTLLLDEINSLPIQLQSKLLRAVDERMYEQVGSTKSVPLQARVIAAANTNLEEEVLAGRFRADLFYRLNVVGFFLPPLRERRGTIIPLANKFLADFAQRNNRDIRRIAPEAAQALTEYDWPGNIRELRNAIERGVALAPKTEIQTNDLPEAVRCPSRWKEPVVEQPIFSSYHEPISLAKTKEEAEILRIRQALTKHGNNRLRAAAELGISRMGLYKKLHKYGMMSNRG